jgi:hypothetical protein
MISYIVQVLSYLFQAVERLNIKTQHYKDLITDEPFTRKDIITLQVRTLVADGHRSWSPL